MVGIKKDPVDKWIVDPIKTLLSKSTTSGIVLFSSATLALILSNSPWKEEFHHLWEVNFSIGFAGKYIDKSLHHWINDGLMAVFFFMVGLELKREIIAGELSNPRRAMLPILAALGGMIFPASIYLLFNPTGESQAGWGVPMATDIAFALGVLYMLGNRVPLALKVFLTALAIADDIGAVLVIAFFYTSDIQMMNLLFGAVFLGILIFGNIIGVRSTFFYISIGIGGVWLAFLLSGVHATIAAVLAAFTIPANVKVSEIMYTQKLSKLLDKFREAKPNQLPTVTSEQLHILEDVRKISKLALTPLQRMEHALHPFVTYLIMPIFALSNAGITFSGDIASQALSPVAVGVFLGLLLGKVIGVLGVVIVAVKLKIAPMPTGVNYMQMLGVSFLAAIGFTMSLFISNLAFGTSVHVVEAKMGIFAASVIASLIGYNILNKSLDKAPEDVASTDHH